MRGRIGDFEPRRASSDLYCSDMHILRRFLNMWRVHCRFLRLGAVLVRRSSGLIRWNSTMQMWVNRIENRARKKKSFWIELAWKSSYREAEGGEAAG